MSSADNRTVLYLIRHGATEANLAQPVQIQGRRHNPPLTRLGVRQAEATRDFLAIRSIDHCYCSPLLRAVQTATIVAAPHGISPQLVEELIECDVEGESFADVHARIAPVLEALLERHAGESILVVGHHVVNRIYLAGLLGLTIDQSRQVTLDNCGISVVVRTGEKTAVCTLNAAFHLQGVAA